MCFILQWNLFSASILSVPMFPSSLQVFFSEFISDAKKLKDHCSKPRTVGPNHQQTKLQVVTKGRADWHSVKRKMIRAIKWGVSCSLSYTKN